MPTGLRRYQQTRQLHFITFSCFRRMPHFDHAASRDLFQRALERVRKRYTWAVIGYVVMPERALPGLKIETWGTLDRGKFASRDLGHQPGVERAGGARRRPQAAMPRAGAADYLC